jgi:hypothetical protein
MTPKWQNVIFVPREIRTNFWAVDVVDVPTDTRNEVWAGARTYQDARREAERRNKARRLANERT